MSIARLSAVSFFGILFSVAFNLLFLGSTIGCGGPKSESASKPIKPNTQTDQQPSASKAATETKDVKVSPKTSESEKENPKSETDENLGETKTKATPNPQPNLNPATGPLNKEGQVDDDKAFFEKKKIIGDAKQEVANIFKDWKKPEFALFISGRQHGYIEPCGCTGLENQKGGLLRRHTLTKTLEANGWNLVKIDAGNQVRRFGPQPELKFKTTAETLSNVFKYDAIGFGRDDFRLPALELVSTFQNLDGVEESLTAHPFVNCNVAIYSDFADESFEEDKMLSTFKLIEVGDKKVCITAILGEDDFDAIKNDDLALRSPDEGIKAVWPQMKETNADVYVLISHTSLDDTDRLAKAFPYFDLVITAGGAGEPTDIPKEVTVGDHTSKIIQVGTKGMFAGVVGFYGDRKNLTYKRIEMTAAYEDSEEIKTVFKEYQDSVRKTIFAKLDKTAVPHPSGAKFVGSNACADCHGDAHDVWKDGVDGTGDKVGPHTLATASLIEPNERNWVVRKYDPECLSCHVTGWNPQKYYRYDSGYLDETNIELHANGCENCHGPGSLHVAAQENEEDVEKYQAMVRITLDQAEQKCQECHDLDNSPDFHEKGAFDEFWKRIDHSGMRE
ncbi:multiheme c-type cytochrome [Pirellulaceae bacterium]|nr:multiheme c-type cytochrome [Pirellulaceae bacterium]